MSILPARNVPLHARSIFLRAFIQAPKLRRKSLLLGEESGVQPLARDLHRCPQASTLRALEALASDSQSRTGRGDDLFRTVNWFDCSEHEWGTTVIRGEDVRVVQAWTSESSPPSRPVPGASCAPLANVVPPHFRSEGSGKGVGVPTNPTPL